jgi:hypothetical protein
MLQVTLDLPRFAGQERLGGFLLLSCFSIPIVRVVWTRGTRASSSAGAGRSSTRSTRDRRLRLPPGRPRAAVEAFPLERPKNAGVVERRHLASHRDPDARLAATLAEAKRAYCPGSTGRRNTGSVRSIYRCSDGSLGSRRSGQGGMTRLSSRRLARRAGRSGDSRVRAVQAPGGPV